MLKRQLLFGTVALLGLGTTVAEAAPVEKVSVKGEQSHMVEYTVKPGDNLYRVSLNHGADLTEVAKTNDLIIGEIISPGDVLYIPEGGSTPQTKNLSYGAQLAPWQYNTLLAVVQQEAGYDYHSALAVMSVITNRVDNGAYGGDTIWEVVTAPGQFEAYGAGHFEKHLGNIAPETEKAVQDALKGHKTVSYLNFWTDDYAAQKGVSGVNIGGNVYFNL